jgi:hypothetical protein
MKQQLGVVAIYHYSRPDKGDESTVVIWESAEAVKSYRESDLIKEAIAYEQKLGLHETTTREGYPLIFLGQTRKNLHTLMQSRSLNKETPIPPAKR